MVRVAEEPLVRLERHWLYPVCAWLALAIPLLVTVSRASAFTQWRDDLGVVRALGLVPVGGEGLVSNVVMQMFSFLPIGGRILRAALASAVILAIGSRLIYGLANRWLEENAWTPRLAPTLALAAALTATLAPTWQLEGTIAAGSTLAAALVLIALSLRPNRDCDDARVWLGFGAFVALTTLESHAAGAVLVVALAAQVFTLGELPTKRSLLLALSGAVVCATICLVPLLLRPFARRAWVHLGYTMSSAGLAPLDTVAERAGILTTWFREVGLIATLLAFAGAVWGLLRARTRWLLVPGIVMVAADAAFPASRAGLLAADPYSSLRLLAVAALACAAGLGIQTIALGLRRAELPMARYAAALLVAFDFTLVLVTGEDSAYPADRRTQNAAEVWTDEALSSLPPRSLVLVRSHAVAWRMWAAKSTRGERPDVVIVPLPLLDRGSVATRLLAMEPALGSLIRDMAVSGRPSELALSTIADKRPLYVELDPSWDRRLLDHLVPTPFWLRFSSHGVGHSDRAIGLKKAKSPFERVLTAAQSPAHPDRATLAVLGERAKEHALVCAALGDRKSAGDVLADLRNMSWDEPFVSDLEARLKKRKHGRIDVGGLMQ